MKLFTEPYKCTLSTSGYDLTFEFLGVRRGKRNYENELRTLIHFAVEAELSQYRVSLSRRGIFKRDLERLITYFDIHIQNLVQDGGAHAAYTFTNLDQDFTVMALSGDVEMENSIPVGRFTLTTMIDIGRGKSGRTIYIGSEALVQVEQVLTFTSQLRTFLDNIYQEKS